jgi:hypothetical protein
MLNTHITSNTGENPGVLERSQPCQHCGFTRSTIVKMPPSCPHYAALRCAGCDLFQGWQPKPQNQEKLVKQSSSIDRLLEHPSYLSDWECNFLKSLRKQKNRTPKQTAALEKIQARLRVW